LGGQLIRSNRVFANRPVGLLAPQVHVAEVSAPSPRSCER